MTLQETSIRPIIEALEEAYAELAAQHDLPAVTITVHDGSKGGFHGYFKSHGWTTGTGAADAVVPEILIAANSLQDREPHEIWGTLAHEAAHVFNWAAGIKDTSRGGRYHNKRFKDTAESCFGLVIGHHPTIGHSPTTVPESTRKLHAKAIKGIAAAVNISRLPEDGKKRTAGRSALKLTCDCERIIRVSRAVYEDGPILCGNCSAPFELDA